MTLRVFNPQPSHDNSEAQSIAPCCRPKSVGYQSIAPCCRPKSVGYRSIAPCCRPKSVGYRSIAPCCRPKSVGYQSIAPCCRPKMSVIGPSRHAADQKVSVISLSPHAADQKVSVISPSPHAADQKVSVIRNVFFVASELEFSFVISRLLFLNHRITSHHSGGPFQGADLVSCGGGGWVRFWSTAQCALLSEFLAHPHASNAIATTDEENKYLVTGCYLTYFFIPIFLVYSSPGKPPHNHHRIVAFNSTESLPNLYQGECWPI